MSIGDIKNRIVAMMIHELELSIKPHEILQTNRLDDLFGMDSIAITELVIGIENEFAITIPAEDLSPAIFQDLETLTEYVRMRLEQKTVLDAEGGM